MVPSPPTSLHQSTARGPPDTPIGRPAVGHRNRPSGSGSAATDGVGMAMPIIAATTSSAVRRPCRTSRMMRDLLRRAGSRRWEAEAGSIRIGSYRALMALRPDAGCYDPRHQPNTRTWRFAKPVGFRHSAATVTSRKAGSPVAERSGRARTFEREGWHRMHQRIVSQAPSGTARKGSRHARVLGAGLVAALLLTGGAVASAQDPSGAPASASMTSLVDDTGTTVTVPAIPQRVISLSPAITEIAFAVGAGDRLVGGTDFDDYPPEAPALPDVATY